MPKLKLVETVSAEPPARSSASARPRRVTPKSEQTRNVILEAAVDCIERYGFHGTNLSRVAEMADVTRGCLQYYFMTTEDIAVALVRHVARRHWELYESRAFNPPPGRDLIEFAIDLVANEGEQRYRIARLELLTAARTTPVLQPVLEAVAQEGEAQLKRFTGVIFGNPALADTPQFRAARDLTQLVSDYLSLQVFPSDRKERMRSVREALRISLHTLWRIPSLDDGPQPLKPRVRVPARSKPA